MSHENEYHDNMVALLELIWSEGYMAPGGPRNVAKMLAGIETAGKRILDIGCGIGGPAFEMVRSHGASVVGIDLEPPLIDRAMRAAKRLGLDDRCSFQVADNGPLPFANQTFDIVVSAGAITQTTDKAALLAEAYRVLKPGGYVSCYDWFRTDREYSDDMRYWFRMEGLTYAMQTIAEAHDLLIDLGFSNVQSEDATAWYQRESHREYQRMRGELYPRMVELLGQIDADHFVENWRAMTVVIDNGEMRQGYFRGCRPA